MHHSPFSIADQLGCLKRVLTLSDYLRSVKRLTPAELKALASSVRRASWDRSGNAERVAMALESVASTRAASNSSAMRRDAPATTLFERLSDWATASF